MEDGHNELQNDLFVKDTLGIMKSRYSKIPMLGETVTKNFESAFFALDGNHVFCHPDLHLTIYFHSYEHGEENNRANLFLHKKCTLR